MDNGCMPLKVLASLILLAAAGDAQTAAFDVTSVKPYPMRLKEKGPH